MPRTLFRLAIIALVILGARDLAAQQQLTLDIGVLSGGLTFAARAPEKRLGVGVGVWAAWSPASTFDRNVFEPRGLAVFVRAWFPTGFQVDAGPALLRYQYSDDCSQCTGTFFGLRLSGRAGRRISVGPDLWMGVARDSPNGSDLGVLVDFQVRVTLGGSP